MVRIESIESRRIFNSHVEPTTEYTIHADDGRAGTGASPHGETVGIYEAHGALAEPARVVETLLAEGPVGTPVDQAGFDAYLAGKADVFGKNACYALSLAFFDLTRDMGDADGGADQTPRMPRLCLNILNGGRHAYTNAVLSDFPEYLLVAAGDDVDEVIGAHDDIQRRVGERLAACEKSAVNGNPVSVLGSRDNRACIEFLLGVTDGLGLSSDFALMIDAAAAGLWTGERYELGLTDGAPMTPEELCDHWLGIVGDYPLGFLEDPFREHDGASWTRLTTSQDTCTIIGDDFYATTAGRIAEGAAGHRTHGVVIKPNQAGSVTAVREAIGVTKRAGLTGIVSHRSVSTESPFEAYLACTYGLPYIKVGPLETDYSSVIRLNEMIRLTERG